MMLESLGKFYYSIPTMYWHKSVSTFLGTCRYNFGRSHGKEMLESGKPGKAYAMERWIQQQYSDRVFCDTQCILSSEIQHENLNSP